MRRHPSGNWDMGTMVLVDNVTPSILAKGRQKQHKHLERVPDSQNLRNIPVLVANSKRFISGAI